MPNILRTAVGAVNSGKKIPVLELVKYNPEIIAAVSKLIQPSIRPSYDTSGQRTINVPAYNNFGEISRNTAEKTKDAKNALELFPDLELSAQILISSIISPKDMGGGQITYTVPNGLFFQKVAPQLLGKIEDYFTNTYKITPLLPKILREVLFESGSSVYAVIPESSLDDFINGSSSISTESLSEFTNRDGTIKNLGILGNASNKNTTKVSLGFESFKSIDTFEVRDYDPKVMFSTENNDNLNNLIQVSDNPYIFKFPELLNKLRFNTIYSKVLKSSKFKTTGTATEAINNKISIKFTDTQLTSLVYKNRNTRSTKTFSKIKTSDETARSNIGAPLIMKLPSESVIPIYTPGQEENHVGYFVLVDVEGNPLNANSTTDHFSNLNNNLQNKQNDMSSFLLNKAQGAMYGGGCNSLNEQIATKVYTDVIEGDILARLRNGIYGNNITIGNNESVYRIMLARSLAMQRTNLLYIPADLVTYFAYKYDEKGIGKSLLDDMRVLNSLRAMTMFARVMSSIKNSIGRTNVNLKLDAEDPNPQKTIEMAIHEVAKTRQQYFPLGVNSSPDLVDWLQKAGYDFTFEGHPGLPDTAIEFSEKSMNYVKPDSDLDDELRKRSIMSLGLSPESVDSGFSAEFATTVVNNNILLAKRVMQIQDIFVPLITQHSRKISFNDGNLIKELHDVVKENKQELIDSIDKDNIDASILANEEQFITFVVSEFLSNYELALPQPDSVTLENQTNAFNAYEEALDKALKYYVGPEMLPANFVGEDVSNTIGDLQNVLKAYFMRQWMNNNGFLSELNDIVNDANDSDEAGFNIFDTQKDYLAKLTKATVSLVNKTQPVADAADSDINTITDGKGLGQGSTGSGFGSPGDSGSDSGSSGGSDDFGMGNMDDLGGDMNLDEDKPDSSSGNPDSNEDTDLSDIPS